MKVGLITTTVNVPDVLTTYAALDPEVSIIVSGDERTPHDAVRDLERRTPGLTYLDVGRQKELGYRCGEVMGWSTVCRRNIAALEAIRLRCDVVITIDDDNLPLAASYFEDFRSVLRTPFSGACVSSASGWVDIGQFLEPPATHRGFPITERLTAGDMTVSPVTRARVGIAAGMWLGDPDTSAVERIANRPFVRSIGALLDAGVLVKPGNYAPFNSQNTAYARELAPLMMVHLGVGRYDDIWSSFVAERVLQSSEYHVHFGRPAVWQQRNPHDLVKDLKDELHGMEHTPAFVRRLQDTDVGSGSVLEKLERVYRSLEGVSLAPKPMMAHALAWCEDVSKFV